MPKYYDGRIGAVRRPTHSDRGFVMSNTRRAVSSAAFVALLALPTAASAAPALKCARTAKVTSGKVLEATSIPLDAQGNPDLDQPARTILRRGTFYYAARRSAITMQRSRFTVLEGAIFGLSCWGRVATGDATYPMLDVDRGTARVVARAGRPAGLTSAELLSDPYADGGMTFSLTRTPRGEPSLAEILASSPGRATLLRYGTTRSRKSAGGGYVNFTPYVGRNPGLRRQAQAARATSTSRARDGSLRGTARFTGLAPFSPR